MTDNWKNIPCCLFLVKTERTWTIKPKTSSTRGYCARVQLYVFWSHRTIIPQPQWNKSVVARLERHLHQKNWFNFSRPPENLSLIPNQHQRANVGVTKTFLGVRFGKKFSLVHKIGNMFGSTQTCFNAGHEIHIYLGLSFDTGVHFRKEKEAQPLHEKMIENENEGNEISHTNANDQYFNFQHFNSNIIRIHWNAYFLFYNIILPI